MSWGLHSLHRFVTRRLLIDRPSRQVVLIRAMRDSNLPKFLSEDAELFEAIVTDLFPGVYVPEAGAYTRPLLSST
jgi:hypothetical protein